MVFSSAAALEVGMANASATSFSRSGRSEEHTSELQSQSNLVCRLLLEKKNSVHYAMRLQLAVLRPFTIQLLRRSAHGEAAVNVTHFGTQAQVSYCTVPLPSNGLGVSIS